MVKIIFQRKIVFKRIYAKRAPPAARSCAAKRQCVANPTGGGAVCYYNKRIKITFWFWIY